MIYVGVDIGKRKHCAVGIREDAEVVLKPVSIEQTMEEANGLGYKKVRVTRLCQIHGQSRAQPFLCV